jgi:hypothetical protein
MRVLGRYGMASAVALSMLVWTGSASAASLQYATISGNDCSGVFGQGFENCSAYGSPIIIKFGEDGSVDEVNSIFPSIDGSEFDFNPNLSGGLTSGTFAYNPNDAGDPAIKYWVAKGGPAFNIFWWGNADPFSAVAITPGDYYSWFTPTNPASGQGYGLSHLGFYDTANGGGGDDTQVPEPASLILFGLGTLAAGYRARRRFTA